MVLQLILTLIGHAISPQYMQIYNVVNLTGQLTHVSLSGLSKQINNGCS